MTTTLAVEDLTETVAELVGRLAPGDEIVLTRGQTPVARLVGDAAPVAPPAAVTRPGPGLLRGAILYMAPDFDAPLEDMKEYME